MRQYLVDMRIQHGMSQQDVASRIGISRQYYQMIENGERQKHLALSLASGLAVLFGVSVMDIERYEKELAEKEDISKVDSIIAPKLMPKR